MNKFLIWIALTALPLTFCRAQTLCKDAVVLWTFADADDDAGENSRLKLCGNVAFITLEGDEALASRKRGGTGHAVRLDGAAWLDAGQGFDGELNLTGKGVTFFVRLKASSVKRYSTVLAKAGDDRNMAYSIALNPSAGGEEVYIEVKMGSDEIGGAQLLKYKLPREEVNRWQDVVFRFDGEMSELYVNGILRDDEVTVGQIRDWNRRPLLIGAQCKPSYGYAAVTEADQIEAAFDGWIDVVALWNKPLSDREIMALSDTGVPVDGRPEYYTEKYRPQFHFSARKNWLNDPNGLVWYDGVYHLFFQYLPPHRAGAYKDWGHAVSKDLVHWEQIPHHITPHKVWSGCWSGSAVVDTHNVAGFQTGDKKPLIAFITNGGHPAEGLGTLCTQCIAYSNDGGMTFTYYDRNPVIRHIKHANRDPKVVWDEGSGQWIMSLFMDEAYEFGLFGSKDLKEWKYLSSSSIEGVRECPGFEPLPVDGDPENKKWIFFGANGDYVIGSFDGTNFTPETDVLRGDYGVNYYAAQTWSNEPGGRCVIIAWMPTRRYPGMPFEQQMNFPSEMTLRTTPSGVKAFRMPVDEIKSLYEKTYTLGKRTVDNGERKLRELTGELYDMDLELDVSRSSSFEIALRNVTVSYDAVRQTLSCGGAPMRNGIIPDNWVSKNKDEINETNNLGRAPLPSQDGKIRLRILLDRNTVEIFGNGGEAVISSCFMPEDHNTTYAIRSKGTLRIVKADIHSLKPAWNVPTKNESHEK